ncbi:MAG TPA: hypothetical protein VKI44_09530 [Acetobacteraceae bacterium]|nr:hypothetical protein [Acetobacteraceae bacterium]
MRGPIVAIAWIALAYPAAALAASPPNDCSAAEGPAAILGTALGTRPAADGGK